MRAPQSRSTYMLVVMALLLCLPIAGHGAIQHVEEGWQYRWGDSPFLPDGTPEWVVQDDPGEWRDIAFPSNPPGREGREHVWFRVSLPEGEWFAPALYIYSVDIIVQIWHRGELFYQYGSFDEHGRGSFVGWPWHEIPLPDDYEGETFYFRVFSDYTDIGLWGEVGILDHPDLVLRIVSRSTESLIIATLSALIALLALVFAVIQRSEKSFASIALFSFVVAVMLVSESPASLLIAYQPLMWDYLAAGSYYLVPVALALLLQQWLPAGRVRIASWLWKFHLLYAAGALGLALLGLVDLSSTFPVFDGLLVITLVMLTVNAARYFRRLRREQQVVLVSCVLFAGFLLFDMSVAHGLVPWGRSVTSWGALAFVLAVISISVWHFSQTQQALYQLTLNLEKKVADRTAKAEALAEREASRSQLLALESKKSQKLADVISELQDSGTFEQAFSPLLRALPELYLPMNGSFYRLGAEGQYRRLVSWGDKAERNFPQFLDADLPGLTETAVPIKSHELPQNLCFFLRVEAPRATNEPEGVVLLTAPDLPESVKDYGIARLLSWVYQSVEKIGVTLSALALRDELQRFSYEDGLTGLKNRRHFDELLCHERAVSQRTERPLSLLMFDIDHFKQFNDTFGHEAGDEALRIVGQVLGRYFRGSDTVCRYGGEEFAVLMPGASLAEARERAERLRLGIASERVMFEGRNLGCLTISAGVACWPESIDEFEGLLRAADQALYSAKKTGRNQVMAAGV